MATSKPSEGAFASLPFGSTLNDSLEMAKRMWGAAGLPTIPGSMSMGQFAQSLPGALPNMIAPTFDTEELDRRIAELRAVEQWLSMNVNMLGTTIQTLEVQRNTIATLKSFTGAMMNTLGRGDVDPAAGMAAPKAAAARPTTPAGLAGWPHASPPPPEAVAMSPAEAAAAAALLAAAESQAAGPAAGQAAGQPTGEAGAPGLLAGMPINPMMWWGALQDQFARIAAASAAAGEAAAGPSGSVRSAESDAEPPADKSADRATRAEPRERAARKVVDEESEEGRRTVRRAASRGK
jgi:hypothetical protein